MTVTPYRVIICANDHKVRSMLFEHKNSGHVYHLGGSKFCSYLSRAQYDQMSHEGSFICPSTGIKGYLDREYLKESLRKVPA